jgi:hypothetical protein
MPLMRTVSQHSRTYSKAIPKMNKNSKKISKCHV